MERCCGTTKLQKQLYMNSTGGTNAVLSKRYSHFCCSDDGETNSNTIESVFSVSKMFFKASDFIFVLYFCHTAAPL